MRLHLGTLYDSRIWTRLLFLPGECSCARSSPQNMPVFMSYVEICIIYGLGSTPRKHKTYVFLHRMSTTWKSRKLNWDHPEMRRWLTAQWGLSLGARCPQPVLSSFAQSTCVKNNVQSVQHQLGYFSAVRTMRHKGDISWETMNWDSKMD